VDGQSDATSETSGSPPGPETKLVGRFTLLDLFLILSGSWALPFAVTAVGRRSWYFAALFAGSVGGIFWACYCRRFEQFLHERLCGTEAGPKRQPNYAQFLIVYLVVLVLSSLLQYALYRILVACCGR
jgi:hypothetical protein